MALWCTFQVRKIFSRNERKYSFFYLQINGFAVEFSQMYCFLDIKNNFYRNSHRRCSLKKVFLKISQISQENTCVGVPFLIKLQVYFKEHLRTTASVFNLAFYSPAILQKWWFMKSNIFLKKFFLNKSSIMNLRNTTLHKWYIITIIMGFLDVFRTLFITTPLMKSSTKISITCAV